MHKVRTGATLPGVTDPKKLALLNGPNVHVLEVEQPQAQQTAVKIATEKPDPIQALRNANQVLTQKLEQLDKIKLTEEKVNTFQPSNPESGCTLIIEDAEGNKFKTGNAALVLKAIEVIGLEVERVRQLTEAEIIEFAAIKAA